MNTKVLTQLAVLVFIALVISGLLKGLKRRTGSANLNNIRGKNVLSLNEQQMYFRLVEAFPDEVILCQVAFAALITAKDRPTRNMFNRKFADFVICKKSFKPVAVIELDDSSHDQNNARDRERDALLARGGLRTQRYRRIPDVATLQRDLGGLLGKQAAVEAPSTVITT